jgi:uncharacterized protein YbjT (DUF2867 family)
MNRSARRSALVLGATGLVGSHLTAQLLRHPGYNRIAAPVRRATTQKHPSYTETVVSFDRLEEHASLFEVDDVFCCLGTTMRLAGSEEEFRKVDQIYPTVAARIALSSGVRRFLLVSSLGADARSRNFYLRVKGETEERVLSHAFELVASFRPSMLLGDRKDVRWEDRVVSPLLRLLSPALTGPLRKYRPVEAASVARALCSFALSGEKGRHHIESDRIQEMGGAAA